jgi:hypothetical protein
MRTITIYILVLVSAVYVSCGSREMKQEASMQITAMVDITDRRIVLPDAETILSLCDLKGDKEKEVMFRLTTMTDKLLNPAVEERLLQGSITEKDNQYDDPDYREKQVLAFYGKVRKAVDTFTVHNIEDSTLPQSECFRSIAQELTRMKEQHRDKSVMVVYSDLGENSDLFRVYDSASFKLLLTNPDSIQRRFEAANLMPDNLSDFTVLFIFQPPDKEADNICNKMAMIYKKMITARGGKVMLIAGNPKYIQL